MSNDGTPIDPPNLPAGEEELNAAGDRRGMTEGARATQFSGQPGPGRPKGLPNRATIFQKILSAKASEFYKQEMRGKLDEVDPETLGEQLAAMLVVQAFGGDTKAMQLIFDSAHGKVSDKIEHTGKDGEKLDGLAVVFVGAKPDGNTQN